MGPRDRMGTRKDGKLVIDLVKPDANLRIRIHALLYGSHFILYPAYRSCIVGRLIPLASLGPLDWNNHWPWSEAVFLLSP